MDTEKKTKRERTISWEDPFLTVGYAPGRTGLELVNALFEGTLPPAPIAQTLGFTGVHAEAGKAVTGNQLGVVLDGRDLAPRLMQRIARELNFSETTFVFPPENSAHAAKIRIFTPAVELPFAGHPTVGTAWVLLDEGVVPRGLK